LKKILALVLTGAFILCLLPILPISGVLPHPEFAMKLDGEFTDVAIPLTFTGIVSSTTFECEIIVWQVVDLYAYEFQIEWDEAYLSLSDFEVKHIHTDDFVIAAETLDTDASTVDDAYRQAVTAIAPAVGYTGTAAVANLVFHIDVDSCYPAQVDLEIAFTIHKMSDSSTGDLNPSHQNGWVKLVAIQPSIKMLPPCTVKSVVGETFEVQIEVQNVVKMKSFSLDIWWDPDQLTTDAQNVWIKDFLPPPYEVAIIEVYTGYLYVQVVMPCEKPAITGTGEILGIRFTALDPWPDASPPYTFDGVHTWYPDKCWNFIYMDGYLDIYCPGYVEQWLWTTVEVLPWDRTTTGAPPGLYEFRPVPGDLNMDGHVDIEDLSAIAKAFGSTDAADLAMFDLDFDGDIDIFDVVIVAKNFCRTEPDPDNPQPLPC